MEGYWSGYKSKIFTKDSWKGLSYFYKMTATYSKDFILPTCVGIAKGYGGTKVAQMGERKIRSCVETMVS